MKVYIALLKPEKNTKENVMCTHHHYYNRHQHNNRASNYTQTSCSSLANMNPSTPSIFINGGNDRGVYLLDNKVTKKHRDQVNNGMMF